MELSMSCPVHGHFMSDCSGMLIDGFDVQVRCSSGCVLMKKVNPVLARRLLACGAQRMGAVLVQEAAGYLSRKPLPPYERVDEA